MEAGWFAELWRIHEGGMNTNNIFHVKIHRFKIGIGFIKRKAALVAKRNFNGLIISQIIAILSCSVIRGHWQPLENGQRFNIHHVGLRVRSGKRENAGNSWWPQNEGSIWKHYFKSNSLLL
jgi:hypothetical protein